MAPWSRRDMRSMHGDNICVQVEIERLGHWATAELLARSLATLVEHQHARGRVLSQVTTKRPRLGEHAAAAGRARVVSSEMVRQKRAEMR